MIAVLVLLSIVLTASVLFPDATNEQAILGIIGGGGVVAMVVALVIMVLCQNGGNGTPAEAVVAAARVLRNEWRMPPLDRLPPAKLSLAARTWMGVLRLYLVVAGGLVLFRIVMLAING